MKPQTTFRTNVQYLTILMAVLFGFACSESSFKGSGASKSQDPEKDRPNKSSNDDSDEEDSDDATDDEDTASNDDDLEVDGDNAEDADIQITTGTTGNCTTKTNLIKNSDFEQGNSGFTSYFVFDSTCKGKFSPGAALQYSVNSTPSQCHVGYASSSGDKGQMLVVNFPAAGQSETRFWCQTVNVVKGRHYKISARLRAAVPSVADSQPTEVTFTIDGKSVLATFKLGKDWETHKSVEIPGASGDVVLCGESRTQNTESTDLIADDFTFSECKE